MSKPASLPERLRRLRRLAALQLLAQEHPNAINLYILRDALARLGHPMTVAEAASLADWLQSAGLVEDIAPGPPPTLLATERGLAAAEGGEVIEGLARPLPG